MRFHARLFGQLHASKLLGARADAGFSRMAVLIPILEKAIASHESRVGEVTSNKGIFF